MVDLLIENHITYTPGSLSREGMLYQQIEYELENYLARTESIETYDLSTGPIYEIADRMENEFIQLVPNLLPPAPCIIKNKRWINGGVYMDLFIE